MSVREAPGTEAAKARLREVGQELELAAWMRKHPFAALVAAAAAGAVAAQVPRARLLMFLDMIVQFVLPAKESPNNGVGSSRAGTS